MPPAKSQNLKTAITFFSFEEVMNLFHLHTNTPETHLMTVMLVCCVCLCFPLTPLKAKLVRLQPHPPPLPS